MKPLDSNMRKVAYMKFGPDEVEAMERLSTLWMQTIDKKHDNVLAYPIDVMVEDVEEYCPIKYINLDDYEPYVAENGSPWLLSKTLHADDIDAFFHLYLHLDETDAA